MLFFGIIISRSRFFSKRGICRWRTKWTYSGLAFVRAKSREETANEEFLFLLCLLTLVLLYITLPAYVQGNSTWEYKRSEEGKNVNNTTHFQCHKKVSWKSPPSLAGSSLEFKKLWWFRKVSVSEVFGYMTKWESLVQNNFRAVSRPFEVWVGISNEQNYGKQPSFLYILFYRTRRSLLYKSGVHGMRFPKVPSSKCWKAVQIPR